MDMTRSDFDCCAKPEPAPGCRCCLNNDDPGFRGGVCTHCDHSYGAHAAAGEALAQAHKAAADEAWKRERLDIAYRLEQERDEARQERDRLRTIAFGYNRQDSGDCESCQALDGDTCPYHTGMDAHAIQISEVMTAMVDDPELFNYALTHARAAQETDQ